MSDRYYLELINTPPRTQAQKQLYIRSVPHEGKLHIELLGGWSEYSPQELKTIHNAIVEYIGNLYEWQCNSCFEINYTTDLTKSGYRPYDWVRCQMCKKKIKRDKLELRKPDTIL